MRILIKMNLFLFFVLLLSTISTVFSVTGFNDDKILLQPMPLPGLIMRKAPRASPSSTRIPFPQKWSNIIFIKQLLELECLKKFYNQGLAKRRTVITKPGSYVPGLEGPAYRTVYKNQWDNYDKIRGPRQPTTGFVNGGMSSRNVQLIPMPVPYRNNMNRYQCDIPGHVGHEHHHFIKDSSTHFNHKDNVTVIGNAKQEMIPIYLHKKPLSYYIKARRSTTTARTLLKGSVNKLPNENVKLLNEPMTGTAGIQMPPHKEHPMMVSYSDAETFSKSSRLKPTPTPYFESTSSHNLWHGSIPPPNHSYEVVEIVEENVRSGEEDNMTKKLPGGRKFKFDDDTYKGLRIVVPEMMQPAKSTVTVNSVNTIFNNLIHPVEKPETEEKTLDKIGRKNEEDGTMATSYSKTNETFPDFPPLLIRSNDGSLVLPKDKSPNIYKINKDVVLTHDNNFFRTSASDKAEDEKRDFQPSDPFQNRAIEHLEEDKTISTLSPGPYDQQMNLFPTRLRGRPNQPLFPSKTMEDVLFTPNYLPEVYNNLDFQILKSLGEQKQEKEFRSSFPSIISPNSAVDMSAVTQPAEREGKTSFTQPEYFEIQTEYDSFQSSDEPNLKLEAETDQSLSTSPTLPDDQPYPTKSVAFENIFTLSSPQKGFTSPYSTWVEESENDLQFSTTEKNYFTTIMDDENLKRSDFKELKDDPIIVDLLNTPKKDAVQESNWKNSRKMHFNQEPTKVVLDNLVTDQLQKGQRRSDILINDTMGDYGENQNQLSSLNYIETLKENSSHLSSGSLITQDPESIIPIIPTVINDLRDNRFSEENIKVLRHAFGKYWPYIVALSNDTNHDMLPLIKMKNKKDLENILASLVLKEPSMTTTVELPENEENTLDYGHAYDYLDDYKEMYQDVLNQEIGKDREKTVRIKRDQKYDVKMLEAIRKYYENLRKNKNKDYM